VLYLGALLVLSGSCLLFSLHARADDQEPVTAFAPEQRVILPAMRASSFRGSYAVLISERGVENVAPETMPRQLVVESKPFRDICPAPAER
jgi:hypothetical protein